MSKILHDLEEGDRFNIIIFSDDVKTFKKEMVDVTPKSVSRAKNYVDSLYSSGCKSHFNLSMA